MAGAGLLALLDDIATVLDDVAVMTKVAAKKTAGVLGDDLALNAQQVTGIKPDREIPVVWSVAKGSFINKLILVPAALLISYFAPWLITPLLMIGGAYLCFEGFEKVFHKALHEDNKHGEESVSEVTQALMDPDIDMVEYERGKIKGAIRTDFILSAEIIVISLGTAKDASFAMQAAVISGIALLMTVGVYGLVAAIVKMDDAGLYLVKDKAKNVWAGFKRGVGHLLLTVAPWLMKSLGVIGTIAMFLVGGSIIMHGLPFMHGLYEGASAFVGQMSGWLGSTFQFLAPILLDFVGGFIAGGLVYLLVEPIILLVGKIRGNKETEETVSAH